MLGDTSYFNKIREYQKKAWSRLNREFYKRAEPTKNIKRREDLRLLADLDPSEKFKVEKDAEEIHRNLRFQEKKVQFIILFFVFLVIIFLGMYFGWDKILS